WNDVYNNVDNSEYEKKKAEYLATKFINLPYIVGSGGSDVTTVRSFIVHEVESGKVLEIIGDSPGSRAFYSFTLSDRTLFLPDIGEWKSSSLKSPVKDYFYEFIKE
ncbi:MAG: hypothetical protein NTX25_23765, partial [Proteobacteria bacterium]|nr:hypothetical protein [Pseudomonadota bacterium]